MATAKQRTLEALGKKPPSEAMGAIKVVVNGEPVLVDAATLTGRERQLMKRELSKLGYEPDGEDHLFAAIWVTVRRMDASITFEEVLDTVTIGQLADAQAPTAEDQDNPSS